MRRRWVPPTVRRWPTRLQTAGDGFCWPARDSGWCCWVVWLQSLCAENLADRSDNPGEQTGNGGGGRGKGNYRRYSLPQLILEAFGEWPFRQPHRKPRLV